MPCNLLNPKSIVGSNPHPKPYRMNDGEGLSLLVQPTGAKLWQYRYKFQGRARILSLGAFKPNGTGVTLAAAREGKLEARRQLRAGIDPMEAKKALKAAAEPIPLPVQDTFAHFADIALGHARARLNSKTVEKWERYVKYAKGAFGPVPVADITKAQVLDFLRGYEAAGKIQTAHDIRRILVRIFDLAGDAEAITHNPANLRARTLLSIRATSHAAIIEPARFAELLRAIDTYRGQPATRACLQLTALTLLRSTEIRLGRWAEIDWDGAQWIIPAERMKTVAGQRYEHVVPLSTQALAILRQLQAVHGRDEFMFPALGKAARPLSENTVNAALRGMGFSKEEMTAHGFRASANSIMLDSKLEWPRWIAEPSKVIDRQLAHLESDETKRAYNRAKLLEARTWMMQAWAALCDDLKAGGEVVPIRSLG